MKSTLFTIALLLAYASSSIAQLGISAGFSTFNAPDWNIAEAGSVAISPFETDPGVQFSMDYWFRLKQKRIEFMPELSYIQHQSKDLILTPGLSSTLKNNLIQFSLNVNIYPFDFNGDCDCPTWSKDGDVFKKGLFVRLAPGVTSYKIGHEVALGQNDTPSYTKFDGNGIAFHLRGGIGLDIGVSDFITVTPIVQYTYTPSATMNREAIGPIASSSSLESSISQLYAGIRFGFRFDELDKYGYR